MSDIAEQIEWIERLVAFDTTSSKSNLALIEDVESYLKSHGAETFRVENDDKTKSNLYAIVGPKTEGGVVLSGHTDVVPIDGQDWGTDPWVVTEKKRQALRSRRCGHEKLFRHRPVARAGYGESGPQASAHFRALL